MRASTMSISPEAGQAPYASPLGTSAAAPGHAPAACCPAGVGSIHSAGQMPSPPERWAQSGALLRAALAAAQVRAAAWSYVFACTAPQLPAAQSAASAAHAVARAGAHPAAAGRAPQVAAAAAARRAQKKSRRPAVRRRADVKARPESLRSAVSSSAPPATRALAGADVYHSSSPLPQPARGAPRRQARRRRWPGPARARSGRARRRARRRVPVLVRQLWRALVRPRLPPAHTPHSRRSGLAVGAAHRARRTASRRPAGSSRTTR